MKFKNKYLKILFLILITSIASAICFNYITPKVHADSGFDGGYSGGGGGGGSSWGGGGSGGGYSSGGNTNWDSGFSYYHEGSEPSIFTTIISIIFLIVSIIIIATIIIKTTKKPSYLYPAKQPNNNNIIPFEIIKITKILPDFNYEAFKLETYEIYKKIQIAWMNFDNASLRDLVTDQMYNMYVSQLETLKVKDEQNVMRDFELLDFEITNMENDSMNISIKVDALISCYDYIINKTKNKTLRGKDNRKVVYHYQMTFIKSINNNTANNFCPNCGAPVKDKASRKCTYCNSIIVSDIHDWVLSKKQVIDQHYE